MVGLQGKVALITGGARGAGVSFEQASSHYFVKQICFLVVQHTQIQLLFSSEDNTYSSFCGITANFNFLQG